VSHQLSPASAVRHCCIPLRHLAEPATSPHGKGCCICRAHSGPLCCQALVAVPDDVDDVAAAQFDINPLTAMGIVEVRHGCRPPKAHTLNPLLCPTPSPPT